MSAIEELIGLLWEARVEDQRKIIEAQDARIAELEATLARVAKAVVLLERHPGPVPYVAGMMHATRTVRRALGDASKRGES